MKIIFFAVTLLVSFSFLAQDENYFHVDIYQNGALVPIENDTVYIEPGEFNFRIVFYEDVRGIEMSASFGKYYYDYPADSNIYKCSNWETLDGCRFVNIKTGAHTPFNRDQELMIGDGNYQSYWCYAPKYDDHDFDEGSILVSNDSIVGERLVKNVYDINGRKRGESEDQYQYGIENLNKEVYLVFAKGFYVSDMDYPTELKREKFILKIK